MLAGKFSIVSLLTCSLCLLLVGCPDGPDPQPPTVPPTLYGEVIVTDYRATGQPGELLIGHGPTIDRQWDVPSGHVVICPLPSATGYQAQYMHPDGSSAVVTFDLAGDQTIHLAVTGFPEPQMAIVP